MISQGICPVWSESSLCAQWIVKGPMFLHGDSEDSDQTGQMPRLIWASLGAQVILLVLSCGSSTRVDREYPEETRWKFRLICVFAGPCYFVSFAVLLSILLIFQWQTYHMSVCELGPLHQQSLLENDNFFLHTRQEFCVTNRCKEIWSYMGWRCKTSPVHDVRTSFWHQFLLSFSIILMTSTS